MRKAKYNRPLTIAFSQDMYDEIKQKSDIEDISMASWIREALEKIMSTSKEQSNKCKNCSACAVNQSEAQAIT